MAHNMQALSNLSNTLCYVNVSAKGNNKICMIVSLQSGSQTGLDTGMKVIRHAGVDSRMIILDDQARQQMTLHFNATFRPSWASSGMQIIRLQLTV